MHTAVSQLAISMQKQRVARPLHLTPRELEVLGLLGEGLPNKLIGRRLNISAATVKCHISRILDELGVASRLQAVVAAARCGLLDAVSPTTSPSASTAQMRPSRDTTGAGYPRPLMAAVF
jgi:DNA-binding CsgD family transcriptional regulator